MNETLNIIEKILKNKQNIKDIKDIHIQIIQKSVFNYINTLIYQYIDKTPDTSLKKMYDSVSVAEFLYNKIITKWISASTGFTHPITVYSTYGYKNTILIDDYVYVKDGSISIEYNIENYLMLIILQYIIMKTIPYNDLDYEVYRGITHKSSTLNDENINHNLKILNSLQDDDIKKYKDMDYKIRSLLDNLNKLFGIPSINIYEEYLNYVNYIKIIEGSKSSNSSFSFDKMLKNYKIENTQKNKRLIDETYKLIKECDFKEFESNVSTYIKSNEIKDLDTILYSYTDYIKNNKTIYNISPSSFSFRKDTANSFKHDKCCLITTKLKPKKPYLSTISGEEEIIFPAFSKFTVINSDPDNIILDYLGSDFTIDDDTFINHAEKFLEFQNIDGFKLNLFKKKYPSFEQTVTNFFKKSEVYYKDLQQNIPVNYKFDK